MFFLLSSGGKWGSEKKEKELDHHIGKVGAQRFLKGRRGRALPVKMTCHSGDISSGLAT